MVLFIGKNKINIKEAITFNERLNGLIGKTNIDYGMLFRKCNSIHTFFMKEDIDIIGLDKDDKIIYIYENLGKNRIIKVNNKINETSILELPKGLSKCFKLNDYIKFQN
ncbi:MAG: DUF192 domain-containing protein [Firmicutes bacterium]|nr:DUF192 domain-containing protein [Bacillota bacterium]